MLHWYFYLTAFRPAVRKLASVGKFNEALSQHSDSVFFLYIGSDDEYEDLFVSYVKIRVYHLQFCCLQACMITKSKELS